MPESHRKPRARRRPEVEEPDTSLSILQAQHAAGRDPDAWAALRPRAIRYYIAKGHPPEQAAQDLRRLRERSRTSCRCCRPAQSSVMNPETADRLRARLR